MADHVFIPIGIGAAPNDGNGTPARTAASDTINPSFDAIFDSISFDTSSFITTFHADLTFDNANPEILGGDSDGNFFISASTTKDLGGNIVCNGESASNAGDTTIRSGTNNRAKWDESALAWMTDHNMGWGGAIVAPTAGEGNGFLSDAGFITTSRDSTGTVSHHNMYNPNGLAGNMTSNGTTVSYNTSSDPRLKSIFTMCAIPRITQGPLSKKTPALNMIIEANEKKGLGKFHFLSEPDKEVWGYNAHWLIDNQEGFGGTEGLGPRDIKIGDVYKTIDHPEILQDIMRPAEYKIIIHEAVIGPIHILDIKGEKTGKHIEGIIKPPWKEKILVKEEWLEKDVVVKKAWTEEFKVTPAGVDQSKRVPLLETALYELLKMREEDKSVIDDLNVRLKALESK